MSDFAKAYYNRGLAKVALGDYNGAIADFDRALALDPDHAEAYKSRGVAYDSLGDKEMARRDFLKARELAEQNNNEQLVRLCNEALSKLDNENSNK